MACKIILTPVIALEEDEAALCAVAEIADKFDAQPIALILAMHLASSFMDQAAPLSAVLEDLASGSRSHAAQLRSGIAAWLQRAPRPFEVRDLAIESAVNDDRIVAHARLADLTIMAHAASHDRARRAAIEDVLFKSGRPMLVVPARPLKRRSWDRVVIGWNATAESVRAVVGAMPFLAGAKQVVITTVDAKRTSGATSAPGQELAEYLQRHDVTAEVRNIDGLGRSHGKALLDAAVDIDADLLVIGAYGHSRARELLFGGVTRELLAGSTVPLLMAH
ncbi:universal stress protein [Terricaulis sp.]|uniref:universal stress protein n=1 Tax=Terricaulis sp. TaxID=2768686 RepID=UPI002AC53481|nr:universal stress protein [Terricaulis sp.]MDZ4690834.1 universal stress protein [Terricaulis sp.]